jgi:hypothetical protein
MVFWIHFWTWVIAIGLLFFVGLSIVVTIGGYSDIRSLFRDIAEQHAAGQEETETGDSGESA